MFNSNSVLSHADAQTCSSDAHGNQTMPVSQLNTLVLTDRGSDLASSALLHSELLDSTETSSLVFTER